MKELPNNFKRGPLANLIILHNLQNDQVNMKNWFEYIVHFFETNNIIPTRINGINKSGKTISFKAGKKQHENIDFKANNMWLSAMPPNHLIDMFEGIMTASIILDERNVSYLAFDNQIVPWQKEIITQLSRNLIEITHAQYGYALQRSFKNGPHFYAYGVLSGIDWDDPESDLIAKWHHKYYLRAKGYQPGDLRDIYSMNILTDAHLNRQIFTHQTLQQWIQSTPNHGILEELTSDTYAWWVEQDQISNVRESLRPSNIIIAG